MSVIASSARKPRRWLPSLAAGAFLCWPCARRLWLWQAWPQVMMKSILWQRDVNQQMVDYSRRWADNPPKAGGSLLAFSFVYGCCMRWSRGTARL